MVGSGAGVAETDRVGAAAGSADSPAVAQAVGSALLAITFADVLFGLSFSEVFTAIAKGPPDKLPAATLAQLVVTGWLIVLSWFGYHLTRLNAPRKLKTFRDKAFIQSIIDAAILGLYFVLAVYAQRNPPKDHLTFTAPAVTIFLVFVLYLLFDVFEVSIERSEATKEAETLVPEQQPGDAPHARNARKATARLKVSLGFTIFMGATAAVAIWLWDPSTRNEVIAWCVVYFVALYLYRIVQHFWEKRCDAPSQAQTSSTEAELQTHAT